MMSELGCHSQFGCALGGLRQGKIFTIFPIFLPSLRHLVSKKENWDSAIPLDTRARKNGTFRLPVPCPAPFLTPRSPAELLRLREHMLFAPENIIRSPVSALRHSSFGMWSVAAATRVPHACTARGGVVGEPPVAAKSTINLRLATRAEAKKIGRRAHTNVWFEEVAGILMRTTEKTVLPVGLTTHPNLVLLGSSSDKEKVDASESSEQACLRTGEPVNLGERLGTSWAK
ncbi:hypothetical protein B0H17DRAFT_1179962 [Mycena rosella]|uniref:Uncharacterized protein n=1 Tax=Mycena rosella TaxID=1033263 RepID=A0AAD7DFN9_MYCRO|nr:hypothetical protein B0H17DRAFT_1179962 [Mycena rosella]